MVQHLVEKSTKITEMREEDFRLWHFIEKIPVYKLTSSNVFIFYKGWGLNKFRFIKVKALEGLKYYYETRRVITPEEYEQFKFLINKNINPFANEALMAQVIHRCIKSGFSLCNEFIPLVISQQTSSNHMRHRYTNDELRLLDQMSIDNIQDKIFNYYIDDQNDIQKEEMKEVPNSEVTEPVKKRIRKRSTKEKQRKELRRQ